MTTPAQNTAGSPATGQDNPSMMNDPMATFGRIDRQTASIRLPVPAAPSGAPEGARSGVLMTISGRWTSPDGDPTPALLEVRTLAGGTPHNPYGTDPARPGRHQELRLVVDSDLAGVTLPDGCVGVVVDVKRPRPGMAIVVRLTHAKATSETIQESEHAERSPSTG